MYDFILGLKFSFEEKQNCIATAHRMIKLTTVARENGILALDNEVAQSEENTFLKMGVTLISNGITSDIMERTFHYAFISNRHEGADLLDRLLISQGLLAICDRCTPYIVAHIMGVMLGEEYLPELIDTASKTMDFNAHIDNYTSYLPESMKFEKRLLKLTRIELSHVLMTMDYLVLSLAFQGCSKFFINRMRDGVSVNCFILICDTFSIMQYDKISILEHQDIILNHLEQLEDSGIIIKTDIEFEE